MCVSCDPEYVWLHTTLMTNRYTTNNREVGSTCTMPVILAITITFVADGNYAIRELTHSGEYIVCHFTWRGLFFFVLCVMINLLLL